MRGLFLCHFMRITNFIRFTEAIKVKKEKRVVSITVRPVIKDSTGSIYFTDMQLQENSSITGYVQHPSTMLKRSANPKHHHNGIVRDGDAFIIPTEGETSTALDCYIYPKDAIPAGDIKLSKGAGSHRVIFRESAKDGDELALLASSRQCLKNSTLTRKHGFFQYTAACDCKHKIKLQDGTSARIYFEYEEMMEGAPGQ